MAPAAASTGIRHAEELEHLASVRAVSRTTTTTVSSSDHALERRSIIEGGGGGGSRSLVGGLKGHIVPPSTCWFDELLFEFSKLEMVNVAGHSESSNESEEYDLFVGNRELFAPQATFPTRCRRESARRTRMMMARRQRHRKLPRRRRSPSRPTPRKHSQPTFAALVRLLPQRHSASLLWRCSRDVLLRVPTPRSTAPRAHAETHHTNRDQGPRNARA